MTREEEISNAIDDFLNKEDLTCLSCSAYSFKKGADWADEHPRSPWINVKDDLPCNHEELMSAKYETKKVFILKDSFGNPDIDCMIKENGKWRWFYYNSTKYWFPIPEPPKE